MGQHLKTTTQVIAYDTAAHEWVSVPVDECSVCGQAWPCDAVLAIQEMAQ